MGVLFFVSLGLSLFLQGCTLEKEQAVGPAETFPREWSAVKSVDGKCIFVNTLTGDRVEFAKKSDNRVKMEVLACADGTKQLDFSATSANCDEAEALISSDDQYTRRCGYCRLQEGSWGTAAYAAIFTKDTAKTRMVQFDCGTARHKGLRIFKMTAEAGPSACKPKNVPAFFNALRNVCNGDPDGVIFPDTGGRQKLANQDRGKESQMDVLNRVQKAAAAAAAAKTPEEAIKATEAALQETTMNPEVKQAFEESLEATQAARDNPEDTNKAQLAEEKTKKAAGLATKQTHDSKKSSQSTFRRRPSMAVRASQIRTPVKQPVTP